MSVRNLKKLVDIRNEIGSKTRIYAIGTIVPETASDAKLKDSIVAYTGVDWMYINTCFTDPIYDTRPYRACFEPKIGLYISTTGNVWPCSCSATEKPAGNLFEQDIMEIFKDGFDRWRNNDEPPKCCTTCESYGVSLEKI